MHPLTESAWLKANRARLHFDNLKAAIKTFSDSQLDCVGIYFDRQTGEKIYRVDRPLQEPPSKLSPIIGDVLFNYRSALDHLMGALVVRSGAEPTERTQFPIFKTLKEFHSAQGRSQWAGVCPRIQAQLEREQPGSGRYAIGARILMSLHSLNIIDKHRHFPLVVTEYAGTENVPFNIHLYRDISDYLEMNMGRVEQGTILARIPRDYVHVDFLPSFDVAFGEGTVTPGRSVQLVLGGIDDVVRLHGILPQYEELFFSSTAKG